MLGIETNLLFLVTTCSNLRFPILFVKVIVLFNGCHGCLLFSVL